MKSLSFIFLVTLYFLSVHINCDSKSRNRTELVNNVTIISNFTPSTLLDPEERGKLCLENIDECVREDNQVGTRKLSEFMFLHNGPWDLRDVRGVSEGCKRQNQKYIEDLGKFKLWALKMYDSAAKLPSGVLNGNINQLGDFDLCLASKSGDIQGQYCLASLQIEAGTSTSTYLAALHRLVQSHYHFKSDLADPDHRVPQFSAIRWATCLPSACTPKDVELGVRAKTKKIFENMDLNIRVKVEEQMCYKNEKQKLPQSSKIAVLFFGGFILFVFAAALYDCYAVGEKNEWIMAFSLTKNVKSMFSLKRANDDIEVIHGIRFINAFMLVISHKSMALFFFPYVNRTEMVEYLARPWTVLARAASLYTDPFIMLSGTLTAYSILGKLQRNNKINLLEEYTSRLLRIMPTFAALIAFCTLILPWMSTGPMWNQVINHHSVICKKNWWRNLLFIHNYYGFKDMCLTHTHHVGIDTQLFVVSPFLIFLLWKWPKRGAIALVAVATISTVMRYDITYSMRLNNYIHYGTSIKQLFDTADNMYILPAYRATVYIMGIILAFVLRNYKDITLSKVQIRIGHALAVLSFLAAFLGPSFMGSIKYNYNPRDAAWYAAFAPIFWCFSFAWIIFASHLGCQSALIRLFSRPIFQFWTKISYTVYLTQFPVFFYNVGRNRSPVHFEFFPSYFNLKEFLWIVALSACLSLLFEMPFANIRQVMFKRKNETAKKVK